MKLLYNSFEGEMSKRKTESLLEVLRSSCG